MGAECPVCKSTVSNEKESRDPDGQKSIWYTCPRCGDYHLKGLDATILRHDILEEAPQRIATLSHWIRTKHESEVRKLREKQGRRIPIELDRELVNSILKNPRPSLTDQADNLVRWIGDNSKTFDEYINVDRFAVVAIVGSATFDEFVFVFGHLGDKGIIRAPRVQRETTTLRSDSPSRVGNATTNSNGQLPTAGKRSWPCNTTNPNWKVLLKMCSGMLFDKPASSCPYFAIILSAGLIDDRLRVEIRAARLLIADLTHREQGCLLGGRLC